MSDPRDARLSRDAFLGGMLHLYQPLDGYRAGVDAVLLAASVKARPGQSVLELGCGVGAAILCLGARVPGLSLTGVEREPVYAALAIRNGAETLEVVEADIADMPQHLRHRQFDHVIANPPYYNRAASVAAGVPLREGALGEGVPLADWVQIASKRLVPKGFAHFIHRAERMPDILRALPHEMGDVEVLPVAPREGRLAELIILRARKNGRGAFRLHPPLIMHRGASHATDAKDYSGTVDAVLRAGAALDF